MALLSTLVLGPSSLPAQTTNPFPIRVVTVMMPSSYAGETFAAMTFDPRADGILYLWPRTAGDVGGTNIINGITNLNTLTGLSQTFATGTSGNDFNIASAGSTHTWNVPTASSSVRGALSAADWTTFNSKVNTADMVAYANSVTNASLVRQTELTAASNAVVTLTSNNVRVAAGTAITVTPAGSGGVMTYTVAATRAGVYRTISIPAFAFGSNLTEGASLKVEETSTNKKTRDYLEFSDATTNGATVSFPMPELWDRGNIETKVYWASTNSAALQTNVWEIAVDTADDSEALDGAYGAATLIKDKVVDANELQISAASGALTFGNSPGAAGALLDLRVRRLPVHADDTLGGVAKLYAVVVRYLETSTEPGGSW